MGPSGLADSDVLRPSARSSNCSTRFRDRETFHQADMLMEGLRKLSPRRLQTLLADCRSVKVKRLFFWFAERHQHAWLKQLDRNGIDLGHGKRMLVRGGKLDRQVQHHGARRPSMALG